MTQKETRSVRIGGEAADHVLLTIGPRRFPDEDTGDYDYHVRSMAVDVVARPFRGWFKSEIYEHHVRTACRQLSVLNEKLVGNAELVNGDEDRFLYFSGDGRGHIRVQVALRVPNDLETELRFILHLDQTQLPAIVRDLTAAIAPQSAAP